MSKSSVEKRYNKQKFVLDIFWNKSSSSLIASQLENERNSQNIELQKLDKYLTLAYINPAKEKSKGNFSLEIFKSISFNFKLKTAVEERDLSSFSNNFNEKLEVYLVFNSSFKIKLSDEFLYNTLEKETEIKSTVKNLSELKAPMPFFFPTYNVSKFKAQLITALQNGKFATLTVKDVEFKTKDGLDLNENYICSGCCSNSIKIKIKAKPESKNFKGETGILVINRTTSQLKYLNYLEAPVSIVKSADNDAVAFKNALIVALKTGIFYDLDANSVDIKTENGDYLTDSYIGTNNSVTVKIVAKNENFKNFVGEKTLKIKRPQKITTKFHIS